MRTIFEQPDAGQVWAQHAPAVDQLRAQFPAVAEFLIDCEARCPCLLELPGRALEAEICSNNTQERLNKELR